MARLVAPAAHTPPETPIGADADRAHLQRTMGRLDVAAVLLCALVGLDTIGAYAAFGPQGLVWFVVMAVLFLLPSSLMISELGSAFPAEGGPYAWARMAFGRLAGSLTAVFYWATNPVWLGGSLTIVAVATISAFLVDLQGVAKYAVALAFIWTAVGAVMLSASVGRWLPRIGALTRIVTLGFFAVSVVVYGVRNGFADDLTLSDLSPTYAVFIAAVPLLAFKFVGAEVGSNAGEEMRDPQRDVPVAVLRSAALTFVLYGVPILGILLVIPKSQVGLLDGFIQAMQQVFTVYGGSTAPDGTVTLTGAGQVLGDITAVAFVLALMSSAGAWIGGADRALATSCLDGAGPRGLGRISPRLGTPLRVNLASGLLATTVMVLAFWLAGQNANRYFAATLNVAISTSIIAYLAVYPAFARLRRTHPGVARPYRVPGGRPTALALSALTTFWIALACCELVWPGFGVGWFGTAGDPEAELRSLGFAGQRGLFEVTQVVPLLVLVAVAVGFWLRGRAETSLSTRGAAAFEQAAG